MRMLLTRALLTTLSKAIYILKLRKRQDLQHIENGAEEIAMALRILKPDTDINVLRQGFILLMTVFDATMFDLMRVALRKSFFSLVGDFGKQDKVALGSLSRYGSFEEFRDQVIEAQLKTKYLKDILAILENKHVKCVDEATGLGLIHLREMVQRRNIHIHNRGRVDERYLERDDEGIPRYNVYNLPVGSVAQIDSLYWEMSNRLSNDCVVHVANWVDSL